MDDAFVWRRHAGPSEVRDAPAMAAFSGSDDEPVLIGVVHGPVEIEMTKDALAAERIPAYVKQNSLGAIYGLTIGSFGTAQIWTMPLVAQQARELLEDIGVLGAPVDAEQAFSLEEDEPNV